MIQPNIIEPLKVPSNILHSCYSWRKESRRNKVDVFDFGGIYAAMIFGEVHVNAHIVFLEVFHIVAQSAVLEAIIEICWL